MQKQQPQRSTRSATAEHYTPKHYNALVKNKESSVQVQARELGNIHNFSILSERRMPGRSGKLINAINTLYWIDERQFENRLDAGIEVQSLICAYRGRFLLIADKIDGRLAFSEFCSCVVRCVKSYKTFFGWSRIHD